MEVFKGTALDDALKAKDSEALSSFGKRGAKIAALKKEAYAIIKSEKEKQAQELAERQERERVMQANEHIVPIDPEEADDENIQAD